ncbi:hypothetical protein BJV77DRAFT_793349 [Russula vinacea]|nr:hypothetical protein BJV77DRAFT_793349 [Russula vinacea]
MREYLKGRSRDCAARHQHRYTLPSGVFYGIEDLMASWRKMYTWRINCSPRFANIWHHEPDDSAFTAFTRYTVMRSTKREMEHKVGLREQGTSDKKGTKKGTCSNRSQSPLSPAGRLVTACVTAQVLRQSLRSAGHTLAYTVTVRWKKTGARCQGNHRVGYVAV